MTRILLNITHGFQARMLLRTEISERLRELDAELIVVAPNANEAYFRDEFDRPGFILELAPRTHSRIEKVVSGMRAYFLMNPSLGGTLNEKRAQYRRNHPLLYWMTRAGNLVLGRVAALRRAYLRVEGKIFDGVEYDELLRRHRPDLVVTGTPGFVPQDTHLLRAARRCGVPSATVMLSWDNLTSKGYMSDQPDYLLVWSDLMRDEAIRYHDFAGTIIEVGAAQFDVHRRALDGEDPATFRARHGIPSEAKLIVWGTINQGIYPNQIDALREYAARVRHQQDRYLWVRVHPQSVDGKNAHLVGAYRTINGPNIRVELPPVVSQLLPWDLDAGDLEHLVALLRAADVVVTPQSTLTIDAACVGTPVVNVAVDPELRRCLRYTHYTNVLKHGGVWVAESMEELEHAVDAYCADPTLHERGRQDIVTEQMGKHFGGAGVCTADVLFALARGATARDSLTSFEAAS